MARCQHTVGEVESLICNFYLCGSTYNCLSRSVPEIHWHVAGTLSNQQTTQHGHRSGLYGRSVWLHWPAVVSHSSSISCIEGPYGRAGFTVLCRVYLIIVVVIVVVVVVVVVINITTIVVVVVVVIVVVVVVVNIIIAVVVIIIIIIIIILMSTDA